MAIKKSLGAALSSQVSDFAAASRPKGFNLPDGHYTCNLAGVTINTADEDNPVDGEPSIVVTTVWVSTAPVVGKQIRLRYNLSMLDKNGEPWMLRNLWDDLHNLGMYSDGFKFNREDDATPELLEKLLELLEEERLEDVTITAKTTYNPIKKRDYQTVSIDVPTEAKVGGASVGSGGTQDDEPPVKPGDTVKYKGRALEVVEYDDIAETVTVRKKGGSTTSQVPLADLEL